jgi:hypothetical protein
MNPIAANADAGSFRLTPDSLRWTILAAPLLILFGAYLLTASGLTATPHANKSNSSGTADDWRRTANGWERTQSWSSPSAWSLFQTKATSAPAKPLRRPARSYTRLDTHPAALALVQLLASIFALTLFRDPQQNPVRLSCLPDIIARSFRSSAFGS